jgi:UDP-N-acetylglucosamine pyrophosphorylase
MNDLNQIYFDLLLSKNNSKEEDSNPIILHQPEKNINSNIICIPIATSNDLKNITIQKYEELADNISTKLKYFTFTIIKMQAGLGSSVKRFDLIKEVEDRTTLGAKGTDLYFNVNGSLKSIAQIQLMQAIALSEKKLFKHIQYKNLVNEETQAAVSNSIKGLNLPETISISEDYLQKKMPTINEAGELTNERMAPAGHGFIGVAQVVDTFLGEESSEVIAIGNGEDLSSSPDVKIINWVIENDIPVVMITTTKTVDDKKGGQISIVKGEIDHVTIVEKAQAESSNQLEYFEELGLRSNDNESLFNTNVVVLNKKALKEVFNKNIPDETLNNFLSHFAPDVIQNVKEQDGKKFTQLESALGSVMLNLDRYFRLHFNTPIVSILNLSPNDRKSFFMPIKKREDYDQIRKNYQVDERNYRLVPIK